MHWPATVRCNAYQNLMIFGHVQSDCDCHDLCDFDNGLGPASSKWAVLDGGANLGVIQAELVLGRGDRQSFEKADRRTKGSRTIEGCHDVWLGKRDLMSHSSLRSEHALS